MKCGGGGTNSFFNSGFNFPFVHLPLFQHSVKEKREEEAKEIFPCIKTTSFLSLSLFCLFMFLLFSLSSQQRPFPNNILVWAAEVGSVVLCVRVKSSRSIKYKPLRRFLSTFCCTWLHYLDQSFASHLCVAYLETAYQPSKQLELTCNTKDHWYQKKLRRLHPSRPCHHHPLTTSCRKIKWIINLSKWTASVLVVPRLFILQRS